VLTAQLQSAPQLPSYTSPGRHLFPADLRAVPGWLSGSGRLRQGTGTAHRIDTRRGFGTLRGADDVRTPAYPKDTYSQFTSYARQEQQARRESPDNV